ncbi:MBL fold metallo-hydrolase [Leptolyngbya sp. 'hensonii']|nr:MBL fold metallo-hydrolase [Leptolyngbya sp. 'hensonii']
MKLTWIDLNTWILELSGQTLLIDPWLVDPLVFYGLPWLFRACHVIPPRYTPETLPPIDLILIAQGQDDHCHKPTLARLDRSIPLVVCPAAAAVVQDLGFTQVTVLAPGEVHQIGDRLLITAVPGAPTQPGVVENGYLLRDQITGMTLYYEPHLSPPDLAIEYPPDVVLAPVIGQTLPLLGQVIMGPQQSLELVKKLQPRYFVPTSLGTITQSGLLPLLIQSVGTVAEFRELLLAAELQTQLLVPNPGETLELG